MRFSFVIQACIKKLGSKLDDTVNYWLPIGDEKIHLNPLLGSNVSFEYTGQIACTKCSRLTSSSFHQGHCFPCFRSLPECDKCMMRPELCHFAKGTCRDETWALDNCMKPHYVYLANTSSAKVGITRETQIPTRWIDQGASFALPIIKVKNRLFSGLAEINLAEYISDKTNWRKMLQNDIQDIDLFALREEILLKVESKLDELRDKHDTDGFEIIKSPELVSINYPVLEYPTKVSSLSFEKKPIITGKLMGIKGQYLLLDTGVLNIRKHTGYNIIFRVD